MNWLKKFIAEEYFIFKSLSIKYLIFGFVYHLICLFFIPKVYILYSFLIYIQSVLDLKLALTSDILTVLLWITSLSIFFSDPNTILLLITTIITILLVNMARKEMLGWGDVKILPTFVLANGMESFTPLSISLFLYLFIFLLRKNKSIPFVPAIFIAHQLSYFINPL